MPLFNGTANNDTLIGSGLRDTLNGFAGDDILLGGAGNDRVVGGTGNDFLVDGAGVDTLVGGGDSDIFSLVSDGATDRIRDFQKGADLIDLSRLGVSDFSDVQITAITGGVRVTAGGEITQVRGLGNNTLEADDFIFADRPALTFDDLDSPNDREGSVFEATGGDYFGFSTGYLSFLETDESTYGNSGYTPTSGDNVAYNAGGRPAYVERETPFDLESAVMSAAWRDGLNLVATAYLGDELIGSEFFVLDVNDPQTLHFDDEIFDHATRVEFATFGGRFNAETDSNWVQFSMDDLVLVG